MAACGAGVPRALVVALRVDAERGDRRATFIKTAHAIALKGKGTLMSGHDRRRLLYADLGCVEGLPVERNPGRASPPAWGTQGHDPSRARRWDERATRAHFVSLRVHTLMKK